MDAPRRTLANAGHANSEHAALLAALTRNVEAVRARVDAAARACGRSDRPLLLAVTKSVGPRVAGALHELGQEDLAENRLQELERKCDALGTAARDAAAPRWHFVGHLQRNKARRALTLASVVHSVDSLELLGTLARVAAEEGLRRSVFLQVKLADEENKGGLRPDELEAALDAAGRATGLSLRGLMVMAPLVEGDGARTAAASVFAELASLARLHGDRPWETGRALLSMGMSDDLEEAVAAGSDVLRIGRALFEGIDDTGRASVD
ncbi:MAG: YggS family pyridoxal phosphate-dependent enzyme [Planctomycetota bacterium]